jgi:L-histidine Nalpha-methyltransferase / hercynylcysteine S-oxide synthase
MNDSQPTLIHLKPTPAASSTTNSEPTTSTLRETLLNTLSAPAGEKTIPTIILYDERGLELYDDLTTHAGEHYYLFPAEESILKEHSRDIITLMCHRDSSIPQDVGNGILLELGCG